MAEILSDNKIKTIAFYLPQYHAIPENDKFWGKGFTEWVNTKKATPLFEGHYQPKVPLNENYYNLLDDNVKIWQADLAKKYGVFGFCYYHYWFKDGKKLLEKPLEQMLKNKDVNIPFCMSWANENWSKRWDGGNQEIITEQDYGTEDDWKKHLLYMVQFFKDERYITLNGDPVFLIYKPEEIPDLHRMVTYWQSEIKKFGFNRICLMIQNSGWYFSPSYDDRDFDYQIKFEPYFSKQYAEKDLNKIKRRQIAYQILKEVRLEKPIYAFVKSRKKVVGNDKPLSIFSYDKECIDILNGPHSRKIVQGLFTDWDNTARRKNGFVFKGGNPEKFGKCAKNLFNLMREKNDLPLVFINAWNEWAEGAYLEPDEKHGYAYLEQLQLAIKSYNKEN